MKKTGDIIRELEQQLGYYKRLAERQATQITKLEKQVAERGNTIIGLQRDIDKVIVKFNTYLERHATSLEKTALHLEKECDHLIKESK